MLRSILLGQLALYILMAAALAVTVRRPLAKDRTRTAGLLRTFIIGVAVQCMHVAEEFIAGFHVAWPQILSLSPWSAEFFVVFNLIWIAVWLIAVVGVEAGWRVAAFPIWFFALGMIGNAVWHPFLAIVSGGYFPGLITSPLVGAAGVLVLRRLRSAAEGADQM